MTEKELEQLQILLKSRQIPHFPSLSTRKQLLHQMKRMLIEQEDRFLETLKKDLGKPIAEAYTSEIAVLINEIEHVLKRMKKWMKPKRSYHLKFGFVEKVYSNRVPYGAVLVISPWNYPLQLALMPVISAFAAGNSCVIKPSELAPATSDLLRRVVKEYFSSEDLLVITGGAEKAKKLISSHFNLLFFTGHPTTGKKVYERAAKQLTPVVMELGGKNPCIIEPSGFSEETIKKIVWGKFMNAGQTCIAPDTLYIQESVYEDTLERMKKTLQEFYSENPKKSADFGRVINHIHLQRLKQYLSEGTVYFGGQSDDQDLFLAPTILTEVKKNAKVLEEEIFGPVFPVIPYKNLQELIEGGSVQRDALVAYLFSKDRATVKYLRSSLKSDVSVNQVIHHAANSHVPFGGVGRSGFGAYHGRVGFETCSYIQTDYRAHDYLEVPQKYPPYLKRNFRFVKRFRRWFL